jgi:creatinine amidohydrolase
MTPGAIADLLRRRPTIIVPVGTTEQHGPHLPLGCDTIIVERLADDLSAAFSVPRAPTVEFGVHTVARPLPGGAALRHRTLHRVMNELIESWEEGAGVREFVILTAQASEAHLEALSTIRTEEASVQVVDIFGLDFGPLLDQPGAPIHGGELDTSLRPDGARAGLRPHAEDAGAVSAGAQPPAPRGVARLGGLSQPRLRPKG